MENAGKREIRQVSSVPGEEPRIFDARDRRADETDVSARVGRADQPVVRPSSFAAASTAFTMPW